MDTQSIRVSAVGLVGKKAYCAHEKGNWGPEPTGGGPGDFEQHPLTFSKDGHWLICDGHFLKTNEEFKIVVPVSGEEEAKRIYGERISKGAHVNTRFDFDANHNMLWLLAVSHPVVRPGEWNQNNVNS